MRVAGLDVGTTHVKAVGVDLDPTSDRPVRVRELRRAPTPSRPAELVALARRLLAEVGDGAAAIGIASMAETGVPLDGYDEPLTDLLAWDAVRPLSPALAGLDEADLFARTGVRLSPKVPLATWAWLAHEHPDVVRRARRWAGVADLVALALTERLVTDHTLAGRTGAHLLADGWDRDLLDLAGVGHLEMPDVGSEPVSSAGVPVVVAGHDHQVGAHAAGVRAPGDTANSLGTTEVVLRVLDGSPDPAAVHAAGMSLVRTVGGTRHALIAGNAAAGAAYAAWVERHGLRPEGLDLPDGPTGVLVLPYLRGRQCPEPDPHATLRAAGGGADLDDASPGVRLRALLEGLALQTRWMDDVQRALDPGPSLGPFVVLGGPGARNAGWTRVKAEVLARPLHLVAEHEPVAVGAAVVAAERAGLVDPGSVVLPTEPLPSHEDRYAAVLTEFVRAARRKDPA